jgi:gliding motility-associated-like protein
MKSALSLIGIFLPALLWAQGENNYWAFGHNVGLDFNQNPPAVFMTQLQSWESGSIFFSNPSGSPLFYSNGNEVWNAANNVMPNGSGIEGNGPASPGFPCSAAQGTLAAQTVSNPNQYYLFALDAVEDVPPFGLGKLRYSVIDMSLNGGMGDVIAAQKNIVLEDSLCEKMVLVPGDGCNYWLIVHHVNKPLYYAFKIDAGGIHTVPVVSTGILQGLMGIGMMAVSPDTRRITLSHYMSGFEMAAFNKSNGEISNVNQFANTSQGGMSSHCFSEDNSKLYLFRNSRLVQYDATLFPNLSAMEASGIEIATGINAPFGYMRRGPDKKIYIATYIRPSLAVINDPNNMGLACNYDPNGIALPSFAEFSNPASPVNPYYGLGVGQPVLSMQGLVGPGPASRKDTLVCPGTKLTFTVPQGRDYYLWSNGNTTPSFNATAPGVYWVHSWLNCVKYADTFVVDMVSLHNWDLGSDTTLCPGASLQLSAYNPAIDYYQWPDGTSGSSYYVTRPGTYYVKANVDGCTFADTIKVSVFNTYARIREDDTTLCIGKHIVFHADASPESGYLWNDGSTGATLEVDGPGTYTVEATNQCGKYTDSVKVAMISCNCNSFVPNAFSPNGDGRNDVLEIQLNCPQVDFFQLQIFNRYGQRIFLAEQPGQQWNGTFNGKPLDTGTYFYYLKYRGANHGTVERKGDIVLLR